jgi:hypothetical protein
MVFDKINDIPVDELELTEAKLFITRLFIQGDYKQYADKFQINRGDLKRILYEASAFLGNKNISCTIALILKSIDKSREVFVSCTGKSASFIINSQSFSLLKEGGNSGENIAPSGLLEQPKFFTGKLNKGDTLLLCSENLSSLLDSNFIQRVVISSKGPEEICKKLLHSATGTGRKDNISVAAFNSSGTRRNSDKKRISKKTLLLIIIPLFLILIGFLIYNLSSGTREMPKKISPIDTFESSKFPPVIKEDNNNQPSGIDTQIAVDKNMVKKTVDNVKKNKKEIIKAPRDVVKKFKNVNFIVNGSVVMISNWESVEPEILSINWDNGIKDKKSIHKYPDYTSIPSSVKITYKDYSSKRFKIK